MMYLQLWARLIRLSFEILVQLETFSPCSLRQYWAMALMEASVIW